jgi:hypothetical protein
MTSEVAAAALRDQAAFESARSQFDITNQRIADLIWPSSSLFIARDGMQGQRRDQATFDATATIALGRFAAASESILCPRTQQWHGMEAAEEELNKLQSVKRYCEALTRILFRARYAPRAGFTYANPVHLMSLGAFGNGCTFVDDDYRSLRYQQVFAGDLWVGLDAAGRVDRVHRRLVLSARQALEKFPENCPQTIRRTAEKNPEATFDFLHCVKPRRDYDPGRRDFRGMGLASYYILRGDNELVEEGGYRTQPYIFSRFATAPGETYGRGPASMVLPTLNTANEQAKTLLRSGQRAVDPPLMTVDDDALEGFNMRSNALNRGWLNDDGTPKVVPLQTGANVQLGMEFLQDSRQVINDAFFVTLFQILIQNHQITATEALLKAQEKGELLGPSVGRQQSEMMDPQISRELDLLSKVPRLLPEMPPELMEAGGVLSTKYTSPLDRLQRAGEGVAMLRHVEAMTPVAQFKPEILNGVNWPKWSRRLAEIQGVPEDVMEDEEAEAAQNAAEAEAAQMQQLATAAPLAGKAALDIARAQEVAGAQPVAGLL